MRAGNDIHSGVVEIVGCRVEVPLEEARVQLMQLAGVGPKVADCICLCGFSKHSAIPVDTHCW